MLNGRFIIRRMEYTTGKEWQILKNSLELLQKKICTLFYDQDHIFALKETWEVDIKFIFKKYLQSIHF